MSSKDPQEITRIRTFLTSKGLELLEDEAPPDSMGCRIIRHGNAQMQIHLDRDRGGYWIINFYVPQNSPDIVASVPSLYSLILEEEYDPDNLPLVTQAEFLEKHWSTILDLLSPQKVAETDAQTDAICRRYLKRMPPNQDWH